MIRVGLIGYGHWGPTVARCVTECGDTMLAAISDLSAASRQRAAALHPTIRIEADPATLIADPTIDAIAIATPVSTHFDLAMAALRAGKHVWVEKPIADTIEKSARMVDEAARRKLVLAVDHVLVHSPAVRALKAMVDGGELGDLWYYDAIRANLGLYQRDVNVIWDLGVHEFAVLDHLLGEAPIAVSATGAAHLPGSPEGLAYVTLHYAGGTIAHVNTSWMSPIRQRRAVIGGSRRMVVYDDLDPTDKLKIYDTGVAAGAEPGSVAYRTGDMRAPRLDGAQPLHTALSDFANAIANGTAPMTDGTMGLRIVETLEAASLSLKRGGMSIDLQSLRKAS